MLLYINGILVNAPRPAYPGEAIFYRLTFPSKRMNPVAKELNMPSSSPAVDRGGRWRRRSSRTTLARNTRHVHVHVLAERRIPAAATTGPVPLSSRRVPARSRRGRAPVPVSQRRMRIGRLYTSAAYRVQNGYYANGHNGPETGFVDSDYDGPERPLRQWSQKILGR